MRSRPISIISSVVISYKDFPLCFGVTATKPWSTLLASTTIILRGVVGWLPSLSLSVSSSLLSNFRFLTGILLSFPSLCFVFLLGELFLLFFDETLASESSGSSPLPSWDEPPSCVTLTPFEGAFFNLGERLEGVSGSGVFRFPLDAVGVASPTVMGECAFPETPGFLFAIFSLALVTSAYSDARALLLSDNADR